VGVDVSVLRLLIEARRAYGPWGETLQLGRQGIHIPPALQPIADEMVRQSGLGASLQSVTGGSYWADQGLLQTLGATAVSAADVSDFEGAQVIHDFNNEIDETWSQRFDTIFDGGALEHIFNIPTASANLMRMLRVGGRLVSINAGNNQVGHGFYQFSPELIYRIFSRENGFETPAVYLIPIDKGVPQLLLARDPETVGRRQEIGPTPHPTYIAFISRKIAHVQPFSKWPQQSDYATAWEKHQVAKA
jgi:hypothetical protein